MNYTMPMLPLSIDLETKSVLRRLAKAYSALAELLMLRTRFALVA